MFREPIFNTSNCKVKKSKQLFMIDAEMQTQKDINFFIGANFLSCLVFIITLIYGFIFSFNLYTFFSLITSITAISILTLLIFVTPRNSKDAFGC